MTTGQNDCNMEKSYGQAMCVRYWRHCSKQNKCRLVFSVMAYRWKKKKEKEKNDHPLPAFHYLLVWLNNAELCITLSFHSTSRKNLVGLAHHMS